MKLGAKFNLVLISITAVGLSLSGFLSYRVLKENTRQEVIELAGLMMESALAMRGYTITEIKPLLIPHMQNQFLPQSVPAYAATQAFDKLRESHAEYIYKEATLNPTNPRDRAVDWETDLIQTFRNFPENKEIIGTRATPTGRSLYLARPIQINNEGCLTCHSAPDTAPPQMVALYGNSNGFGWKLNEIVGAQIVSVPMEVPIAKARRAFVTFLVTIVLVFLVIGVVTNVMLRRMVITPVVRISEVTERVSTGDLDAPQFDTDSNDEIGTLSASFNRMRRSLEKAMQMLR
jgi:protein-histidine pros-kinase